MTRRESLCGLRGQRLYQARNTNTTVNVVDNKDNTVGGCGHAASVVKRWKSSASARIASRRRTDAARARRADVVTKSGSNNFHGSLYGFFRTQDFQTNNYFAEQGDSAQPDYSRQQYGGSFGGPIRKDKDFGFFAMRDCVSGPAFRQSGFLQ